ncbi:MAG: class I lanthipeptide [Thermoanaerobaculia bacterium]
MKKSLVPAEKKFGKLSLHRETLKSLSPSQLTDIVGAVLEPQFPSQCSCCITECCC